ncbi:hypothetical protein ON064_04220, partial [Planococcus sp. A6]|uniref:hypothetical protein n=1 Tax=Planococcus sp. A6 TaxID=2992760 RepID=UPI00237B458B
LPSQLSLRENEEFKTRKRSLIAFRVSAFAPFSRSSLIFGITSGIRVIKKAPLLQLFPQSRRGAFSVIIL